MKNKKYKKGSIP